METAKPLDEESMHALREFFNHHHDKLMCTANERGEPSVALMGTPRLLADNTIDVEISDRISVTLDNIRANRFVVFVAYVPGPRARDYHGARIYAEATEILSAGEKFEGIKARIRERFGEQKAGELEATINFKICRVRPIVDRGQRWNEPPFEAE